MFGGEPLAEEVLAELEKVGVEYTDYPFPRERDQSAVVEVDSAATLKVLSLERSGAAENGDLAQRLRAMDDPKLRKGNKESRAAALRGAIETLWDTPGLRLRTGNLSSDIAAPENVDVSKLDVSAGMSHAELDRTGQPRGRHARRLHGPPPLAREGRLDGRGGRRRRLRPPPGEERPARAPGRRVRHGQRPLRLERLPAVPYPVTRLPGKDR